ncbi:MAG: glycosyltransferase [Clostridiales Family XIII bacterium]|jgi:glycosyltransferase involved in cell wall biosynthesis|nr:glycosyltransferase [Clostridiales Family XIII bacterium]
MLLKPYFSIIVPMYNVDKYLKQCLDSIISQKFDSFEIVIVDDGSTDNSSCIANKYIEKYDNIQLITQVNGGLSSARNVGIKYANGKFLIFLDSDDLMCENYLNQIYNVLIKRPNIDILCEGHYNFRDTITEAIPVPIKYTDDIVEGGSAVEILADLFRNNGNQIVLVGRTVYRKSLIMDNNICFDITMRYAEDTDFFYHATTFAKRIYAEKEIFAYYYRRQRDGSLTANPTASKMINSLSGYYRWWAYYDNYVEENNNGAVAFLISDLQKKYLFYCIQAGILKRSDRKQVIEYIKAHDDIFNKMSSFFQRIVLAGCKLFGYYHTTMIVNKIIFAMKKIYPKMRL